MPFRRIVASIITKPLANSAIADEEIGGQSDKGNLITTDKKG